MLMMRLQRVGRKNDPSYRIVVTDKRTGPKSNKHIAVLGSYNPKMNHTQLDTDLAKEWLSKGVQPSDTVHNILVSQKVIDAKKLNVLPKKSPIVDEEAIKKAEEEKAAAEAEAEAAKAAEAEAAPEESTETASEEVAEESPATETAETETATEAAANEEPAEEVPAEPTEAEADDTESTTPDESTEEAVDTAETDEKTDKA